MTLINWGTDLQNWDEAEEEKTPRDYLGNKPSTTVRVKASGKAWRRLECCEGLTGRHLSQEILLCIHSSSPPAGEPGSVFNGAVSTRASVPPLGFVTSPNTGEFRVFTERISDGGKGWERG